jgi:hypothetical protein
MIYVEQRMSCPICHSGLDPPTPYWIRGLSRTGYGGIQSGPLDTGFRRYDELTVSRGVSTLNEMNAKKRYAAHGTNGAKL